MIDADKWRNPGEDLPSDFARRRAEHYAALGPPAGGRVARSSHWYMPHRPSRPGAHAE